MIQLGGKKKTRAVYNCCIKGTTFYFQKKVIIRSYNYSYTIKFPNCNSGSRQTLSLLVLIHILETRITYYYARLSNIQVLRFYSIIQRSLGSKEGKDDKIAAVPLTGTEIRRIEEKQGRSSKYTIEIMHPQRKIMYKVDYLYLISESAKDAERWYFALLQIGKKNTHAYLTPVSTYKQIAYRFKDFMSLLF
jgi:hypothetical protein